MRYQKIKKWFESNKEFVDDALIYYGDIGRIEFRLYTLERQVSLEVVSVDFDRLVPLDHYLKELSFYHTNTAAILELAVHMGLGTLAYDEVLLQRQKENYKANKKYHTDEYYRVYVND